EAAETVCGVEHAAGHVLDGIALLLDKSLLQRETGQHGEARYVMLETVREYAMERLEVSGESESTHARYLAYYAHMLREADQELYGPKRLTWYKWFDDEVHNVRAALATTIASDAQAALWMASTFA
ncbi:MAG: LuxR family transcriptional regulator, partial [Anaerolineae bacterium]|nr:LuxR family transcriptional regulator [Anaerolineae bacterium]